MDQNKLLPIFLKISKQRCLVVGGGKVAYQKIQQLAECEAEITVLSKECLDNILSVGNIKWIKSNYNKRYLNGYKLVISATSDSKVNKAVYKDAEEQGIPVNIVDQPELCSYYFGSVYTDGNLKIAISTNGKSPSVSKRIKNLITMILPKRLDLIINQFSELRNKLINTMSFGERKSFFDKLSKEHINLNRGKVIIVGAGPGSPDLLTLKAAEVISSADVILYDALIHLDILKLASNKAKKVFVGKRSGRNCINQSMINKMLVNYAQMNKIVVRLKGGDPFLFGRGGEEAVFLRNHNIKVSFISGITSGIGATTEAGIPLTHRKYSQGVLFLTGHESGGNNKVNWDLVSKLNMTLVIYMGYKNLNKILLNLINNGKDRATPIGLIQKGTTIDEKIIIGEIGTIEEKLKQEKLETPVIIVIGTVVDIYKHLKDYIYVSPSLISSNALEVQTFQNISN